MEASKQRILIFIDAFEKYNFFKRFIKVAGDNSYEVIFITNKYSLHLACKLNGKRSILLNYNKSKRADIDLSDPIKESYEFMAKELSYDSCQSIAKPVYFTLSKNLKNKVISYAFIWNGSFLEEKIIEAWCNVNKVKTLFFEISNLDNKLQVDSVGINAKSSFYNNLKMLDGYGDNSEIYKEWNANYIEKNIKKHTVKQALKVKKINYLFLLDWLYFKISNKPVKKSYFFSKILDKYFAKKIQYDFHDNDPNSENYMLFPLQVLSDTQGIINSDITLEEAIGKAYEISSKNNNILYVKPHPAEKNVLKIKNIIDSSLKKYKDIKIVDGNTFNLMQKANAIITVNSSVGLQAKIMGKDVKVLGRAIYADMTEQQLQNYIMKHLVNIDYFSLQDINEEQFKSVLAKLNQ